MAEPNREEGDEDLIELFRMYGNELVTPATAASLLGLSRKTIHTLADRGHFRIFRSSDYADRSLNYGDGPRWAYIPLEDVIDYGERVGRSLDRLRGGSLALGDGSEDPGTPVRKTRYERELEEEHEKQQERDT